jgi:hypothetical protein
MVAVRLCPPVSDALSRIGLLSSKFFREFLGALNILEYNIAFLVIYGK